MARAYPVTFLLASFNVRIGSTIQEAASRFRHTRLVAAVQRQPNVSKEVKNVLPRLEVIIDHLEEAKKDENEARRKLTSFAAIAGGGSFKR